MKKRALPIIMILLLAMTMSSCMNMDNLDEITDRAINAVGGKVSDAMEDVDVREVMSTVADKVGDLLESMPQTSGALQDTVSGLTSTVKSDISTSSKKGEESAEPAVDGAEDQIDRQQSYTSLEEVVAYLRDYGVLPPNFLTTAQAEALGWDGQSDLWDVQAGASIGGDDFGNMAGLLPSADGRSWKQCDINYQGGDRGNERLCYSNDGLYYYSADRFSTFTEVN
jgi:hypothetical protein